MYMCISLVCTVSDSVNFLSRVHIYKLIDSMQHSYIHYRSYNSSIDELVQADTLVLLEGGLSSCSYVNVSSTITNVNC